jgi:hypothetical protein
MIDSGLRVAILCEFFATGVHVLAHVQWPPLVAAPRFLPTSFPLPRVVLLISRLISPSLEALLNPPSSTSLLTVVVSEMGEC